MCLCDLQGGQDGHQYVLYDVVILSKTRQFGATDLGQPGIENFSQCVVEFVVKFGRSRQGTRTPQLLNMNWSAGEGMMVFAV